MNVKIIPNTSGSQVGKLADAELHFTDGPLGGLKLIGFCIWDRRGGGRNVTFPARLGGHPKPAINRHLKTGN